MIIKMVLTELTEQETKERVVIGKPVVVVVSTEGYPDYSERVRAMINAQAPESAKAFAVGQFEGLPTQTEVKVWGNIIDGRKNPTRTETQTWYAHPVQYFN